MSTSIGYGITNFAATNLKGTSLPVPAAVTPPEKQHKTLPHALGRAATQAANGLQAVGGGDGGKFGKTLGLYAGVWDRIAVARVEHDETVKTHFLAAWQVCFGLPCSFILTGLIAQSRSHYLFFLSVHELYSSFIISTIMPHFTCLTITPKPPFAFPRQLSQHPSQ
jgi:hypothetical protein